MNIKQAFLLYLCLMITLFSTACNFPGFKTKTPSGPQVMYTLAAQTMAAQRRLALGTARPTITSQVFGGTPTPIITLPEQTTTTSRPPDGIPPQLCDRARFISDVSVSDDTILQPNEAFVKVWRIKNNGTCIWSLGYSLAFTQGYAFGAPAAIPLSNQVVYPDQEIDVVIQLIAPELPGIYQGDWMLRNDKGTRFGFGDNADLTIWTRIQVVNSSP